MNCLTQTALPKQKNENGSKLNAYIFATFKLCTRDTEGNTMEFRPGRQNTKIICQLQTSATAALRDRECSVREVYTHTQLHTQFSTAAAAKPAFSQPGSYSILKTLLILQTVYTAQSEELRSWSMKSIVSHKLKQYRSSRSDLIPTHDLFCTIMHLNRTHCQSHLH